MRMGRLFKCVLAVAMLLSIFSGIPVSAAGTVTVQVADVSAKAGQTVTTELVMDGAFAAFQGALIYDTNALTLENIEATSLLSGSLTSFTKDEISGKFTSGSFVSASAKNATVNGAVLKFTFTAGSKANGTYSFSLEQFKVYDEKGEQLTVNTVGTLVVSETSSPVSQAPSPSPTSQDPVPSQASQSPSPGPTSQDPAPSSTGQDPAPSSATQEPTPQKPTPTPTSNYPDSDQPDGINESGDDNSSAGSGEGNAASDTAKGTNPVFIVLIILAVVAVGVVVAVIVVKKRKSAKAYKSP